MLREVELPNGTLLFVEVQPTADEDERRIAALVATPSGGAGAPRDAERTSASNAATQAADLLRQQIDSLGYLVQYAIKTLEPDEIRLEAQIKFSGKTTLIPFLVAGKGEGGIKITYIKKNRS